MGMMQKMRSLTPVFIIGVGGLFVLFMVLSDSRVLEVFGQSKNVIGSVNGEKITYEDFNKAIDRARQNYKEQSGQDIDDEQMDAFREQVWDQLVTEKLVEQQIKKFGIDVADKEIDDILFNNPPEGLRKQFTDSLGNFRKDIYLQAIKDPRNKAILANLKIGMKEQVKQMKLQSYLFATANLSEGELVQKYKDNNIYSNVEYLALNADAISDNEVKVTDSDLQAYYEKHIDDYKYEPQRKLKYVLFKKQPSNEDSVSAKNALEETRKIITSDTTSLKSFENPFVYSKDTLSMERISPAAFGLLNNATTNTIIGPVKTNDGYALYKLISKVAGTKSYAKASHILVKTEQEANEVYARLEKGENFAQLAKTLSQDPGSAANGGDLGWFPKGQMVKEFDDACFNGPIGKIQKPVKSSFGYHIIKVEGKSNTRFYAEELLSRIRTSQVTLDMIRQKASDFQYVADKNGFESEAKELKYQVIETPEYPKQGSYIPGLGANPGLINWSFDNKQGAISPVMPSAQGYVVVYVSEAKDAGVKKFDEIKANLKPIVLMKMKVEKAAQILANVKKQINSVDSLKNFARLDSRIRAGVTGRFSVSTTPNGIGRDWKFIDKAMNGQIGKVTDPIKGRTAAYVIRVNQRDGFDKNTYKIQRNSMATQTLGEKKQYLIQMWLADLKKNSDIKDERYKFFR